MTASHLMPRQSLLMLIVGVPLAIGQSQSPDTTPPEEDATGPKVITPFDSTFSLIIRTGGGVHRDPPHPPLSGSGKQLLIAERAAHAVNDKIHAALNKTVQFEGGPTTVEAFAETFGKRVGVPVWLDSRRLIEDGVKPDESFSEVAGERTARQHLSLILGDVVGDLDFIVRDGLVVVTTSIVVKEARTTVVYDVTDLLPRRTDAELIEYRSALALNFSNDRGVGAGGAGGLGGGSGGGGYFQISDTPEKPESTGGSGLAEPSHTDGEDAPPEDCRIPRTIDRFDTTGLRTILSLRGSDWHLANWSTGGGEGDLFFITLRDRVLMVVMNSADVQREVAALLSSLREVPVLGLERQAE